MSNLKVSLEQQSDACVVCDVDDERYTIVVSKLGHPAEQYCLTCASSLHNQLDRILREVPLT